MAKKLNDNDLENVSGGGCDDEVVTQVYITYTKAPETKEHTELVPITHKKNCGTIKIYDLARDWCTKHNYTWVKSNIKSNLS